MEAPGRVPQGPVAAPGDIVGGTRMAGRELLRRRHIDGGCAAACGSLRRAGGISSLPKLCCTRYGPPVLREGTRGPDGAFCGGGLSNIRARCGQKEVFFFEKKNQKTFVRS